MKDVHAKAETKWMCEIKNDGVFAMIIEAVSGGETDHAKMCAG